jgi:hypothetical protein
VAVDALNRQTEQLLAAVDRADTSAARRSWQDLVGWLHDELVPHALAEEAVLYPAAAARAQATLLVRGMRDEHCAITALVAELEAAGAPVGAAAAARARAAVFGIHVAKENDLLVPLLAEADDVSLTELLRGVHGLHDGHDRPGTEPAADSDTGSGCGCGGCGCGGDAAPATAEAAILIVDPRLDVRDIIPHER